MKDRGKPSMKSPEVIKEEIEEAAWNLMNESCKDGHCSGCGAKVNCGTPRCVEPSTHSETCYNGQQLKAISDLVQGLVDSVNTSRATQMDLNRRNGTLLSAVQTQSEKGMWYVYYRAASSLYDKAHKELETLKKQMAYKKELEAIRARKEGGLLSSTADV